ncbi:MAG: hypothetical protein ETSY2_26305 [Candidatus Entotheonella gemina]|uniref:Uncharacterized protein n=1 Tax=Candidatus Entotheonella gemina TaxID=1429439 RepID=W4M3X2_9BACT|nr:MAG: hypothetical protein ETSY2_26305 [Candidatus Entotheonella gemina]
MVRVLPAQKGILQNVFGIGHGAKHAVGDAEQVLPVGFVDVNVVHLV